MQQSYKLFTEIIKVFESEKFSQNLKRKDSPLCIKLIPNLERIKIEKAQTAKEVKLKQLEQTEPNADT